MKLLIVYAVLLLLALLAGCHTTTIDRAEDLNAQLPRAQGLGAFAPSCVFLCWVEASFRQTIDSSSTDVPTAQLVPDPREPAAGVSAHRSVLDRKKGPP